MRVLLKRVVVFFLLLMALLLTACGKSTTLKPSIQFNIDAPKEAGMQEEGVQTEYPAEKETGMQTEDIQAEYPKVFHVILERDEETALRMAEDLVGGPYEADYPDSWIWTAFNNDIPVSSFSLDDAWVASYFDSERGEGGMIVDEELAHIDEFGYITTLTPHLLDYDAMEAVAQACEFLKPYSNIFTFQPYRVLTGNIPSDSQKAGYYEVHLQASYDNIPVSYASEPEPIYVEACIGQNGVFQCNGRFLLKETGRSEIDGITPISVVSQQLEESYLSITDATQVEITDTQLQYFFSGDGDGNYTLEPVWALTGTGSFEEGGTVFTRIISFLYFVEDGTLCGVYTPVV